MPNVTMLASDGISAVWGVVVAVVAVILFTTLDRKSVV